MKCSLKLEVPVTLVTREQEDDAAGRARTTERKGNFGRMEVSIRMGSKG